MEGKGVIIEGWTYPTITNLSNFKSLADIKQLYDAIRDGTCKAVKLSQQEWNSRIASNCMRMAMGEDVYPDTLYNQKSLGKRKAKDIAEEEEGGRRRGGGGGGVDNLGYLVVADQ